jgi:plasmid stabilization system protein ParE
VLPVQSSSRVGLALEFIAEIDRCVSLASKHPLQFAVVREDIRRVVANRFPYSVYFRAEESRIVVLAVFHGSRSPAIWQART